MNQVEGDKYPLQNYAEICCMCIKNLIYYNLVSYDTAYIIRLFDNGWFMEAGHAAVLCVAQLD